MRNAEDQSPRACARARSGPKRSRFPRGAARNFPNFPFYAKSRGVCSLPRTRFLCFRRYLSLRRRTRQKAALRIKPRASCACRIRQRLLAFDFLFARDSFAGLISHRAAGFASGLAGASAFAASRHFSLGRFRNRLNHNILLQKLGFISLL